MPGSWLVPGVRDLVILPNTLTPARHLGYAVQWFGLALTVLVVAVVLTFEVDEEHPMMMGQVPDQSRSRNRRMLVVIFALFFGGMLVAGLLRFSGWRPQGTKNKGEMLQPYGDLRTYTPTLSAGGVYRWGDSPRTWRIVVAPSAATVQRLPVVANCCADVDIVWQLMGKDADRVHVLWVGEPPAGAAAARSASRACRRRAAGAAAARYPARRVARAAMRPGWSIRTASWCCATLRASIRATCARIFLDC